MVGIYSSADILGGTYHLLAAPTRAVLIPGAKGEPQRLHVEARRFRARCPVKPAGANIDPPSVKASGDQVYIYMGYGAVVWGRQVSLLKRGITPDGSQSQYTRWWRHVRAIYLCRGIGFEYAKPDDSAAVVLVPGLMTMVVLLS